jgi:MarR family transcriptional regulator, temperature-dependent positive regulator of motility
MQQRLRRAREIAASREAASGAASTDLQPMVSVKLWHNPCRLSFRVNYIAHHFNQPLYAWIGQRYKLTAPEHVVLYAVGLKDGITADDIAESSSRPKNTLSRAVNSLISKKLLFRTQDRADRRRLGLHLTRPGRRIVEETVPAFVAHEQAMASALTPAEQRTLNGLLTKIILGKANWPTIVQKETAS